MTDNEAFRPAANLPARSRRCRPGAGRALAACGLAVLLGLALALAPGAGHAQSQPQGQKPAAAKPQAKKPAAQPAKPVTKRIGSFQGWDAYEHTDKGKRLCYLHALPQKKEPASARRGEIYILVAHKPQEKIRNEVSIYFGYPLKPTLPAQAVVDATPIEMGVVHEEAAWAVDAATDQKLVDALRKGKTLVVKGESQRGTRTTDTYDLNGFTLALQAIDKACNMATS